MGIGDWVEVNENKNNEKENNISQDNVNESNEEENENEESNENDDSNKNEANQIVKELNETRKLYKQVQTTLAKNKEAFKKVFHKFNNSRKRK